VLIFRLGHREQKDEWAPRRVEVFQRHNVLPPDAIISAGSVNSACTAGMICCMFMRSTKLIGYIYVYVCMHIIPIYIYYLFSFSFLLVIICLL